MNKGIVICLVALVIMQVTSAQTLLNVNYKEKACSGPNAPQKCHVGKCQSTRSGVDFCQCESGYSGVCCKTKCVGADACNQALQNPPSDCDKPEVQYVSIG